MKNSLNLVTMKQEEQQKKMLQHFDDEGYFIKKKDW
jgi:hypothetical protein